MNRLTPYFAGLVSCIGTGSAHLYAQDCRPDIVLIMTDQQSFDMISCLNDSREFSTPNLDRLFRNGIRFSNCYVANPVSVPSRFALMTGVSPAQYGVRDNLGKYSNADESGIRRIQQQSLGALFSNAGYDTYYAGKVHLPYAHGKSNMFASTENYRFQHYLTRDDREGLSHTAAQVIRERVIGGNPMLMVLSYLNPHDICAEAGNDLPEDGNERDSLTAVTIKEMRKLADATSPALYPPLPPNLEKTVGLNSRQKLLYQDFTDEYWRRYRFIYQRLVELVDRQIGIVLDAIGQSAINNNTIVVFTSDHGEMGGAHRLRTKNVPYSECQKVPLVFYGKGIEKARTDRSVVCNGADLLPTLCELGEIEIPDNLPGKSLAKRIKQKTEVSDTTRTLFLEGAQFYQLVAGLDYKYTRFTTSPYAEMLIDLKNDPYETLNLADHDVYFPLLGRLRDQMNDELAKRSLPTSIGSPTHKENRLSVIRNGTWLTIQGFSLQETLCISNLAGTVLYRGIPQTETVAFELKERGCYLIATTDSVCKVIY